MRPKLGLESTVLPTVMAVKGTQRGRQGAGWATDTLQQEQERGKELDLKAIQG